MIQNNHQIDNKIHEASISRQSNKLLLEGVPQFVEA